MVNKDNYLVEDIRLVHSFDEYVEAIKHYRVADIQPLRDLSYKIDSYFEPFVGKKIYIITNLSLWMLTCFFAYNILLKLSGSTQTCQALILIFCTHPLYVQTVAWISARKHLLSFLFILIATDAFVQILKWGATRKLNLKMIIFFLASLLSQPISLFWSVWAFIAHYCKSKNFAKSFMFCVPIFSISFIVGLLNVYYYEYIFSPALGVSKYADSNDFADRLLALGRYFVQIVLPISYASFYFIGSTLNLAGIVFLVLGIFFSYKLFSLESNIKGWSLFFLGLFPVVCNMTNVFISDTYVLLASFSIFMLIAENSLLLEKYKSIFLPVLMLSIPFVFRAHVEASLFTDTSLYFKTSYLREPDCINLQFYVQDLFEQGNTTEGAKLGDQMILRQCHWASAENIQNIDLLFAKILVFSNSENVKERENELVKLENKGLYYKIAHAAFLVHQGNRQQGFEELQAAFNEKYDLKLPEQDVFRKFFNQECHLKYEPICSRLNK